MPATMHDVFSSHISQVGYDADVQELYVRWDTGKVSVYQGVPADVAKDVTNSVSIGTAQRDQVKSVYPHMYLSCARPILSPTFLRRSRQWPRRSC